jgi:tetratricopeptide (TPR) repeat protein
MLRCAIALLAVCLASLYAQDAKEQPQSAQPKGELKRERPPAAKGEPQAPPEEDEAVAPTVYSFNPLQAEKDMRVGDYYLKQGSFRAAAGRYREATRWNAGSGEAWKRLGEASEKLRDLPSAREAYAKYLSLAPDAKDASRIKKKLAKLK